MKKIIGFLVVMLFLFSAFVSAENMNVNTTRTTDMDSENIEFVIELVDVPETIIVNQKFVDAYCTEYSWDIFIDVDRNVSTGDTDEYTTKGADTRVRVFHNKEKGWPPYADTIITCCTFETMVWDNQGWFEEHTIEEKYVKPEKDLIALYCPKNWSEISEIDSGDRIYILAGYTDGINFTIDVANGTGFLTDSVGDVRYHFIDVVRGGIAMPTAPEIVGDTSGKLGKEIIFTFLSTDAAGNHLYYYVDWGDGIVDEWVGPFASGEEIDLTHVWEEEGDYRIRAQAKSSKNIFSDWATLEVSIIKCRVYKPLYRILDKYPRMLQLLERVFAD